MAFQLVHMGDMVSFLLWEFRKFCQSCSHTFSLRARKSQLIFRKSFFSGSKLARWTYGHSLWIFPTSYTVSFQPIIEAVSQSFTIASFPFILDFSQPFPTAFYPFMLAFANSFTIYLFLFHTTFVPFIVAFYQSFPIAFFWHFPNLSSLPFCGLHIRISLPLFFSIFPFMAFLKPL